MAEEHLNAANGLAARTTVKLKALLVWIRARNGYDLWAYIIVGTVAPVVLLGWNGIWGFWTNVAMGFAFLGLIVETGLIFLHGYDRIRRAVKARGSNEKNGAP
jgi:hypothetical protein